MSQTLTTDEKLKKNLGLFDVYAICTGAMFSSGFFLLPGLAAAQTGPSVALAYLIAGILMLPAMFSMAELATAMPRAGGDYYFLDRAMGPLIGTVGGTGTYLALTLKSAFALIGMGAYLAIFVNIPIQPLAVGLTLTFMMLNIFGAKETTGLQRLLVILLVAVMCVFLVGGIYTVFGLGVTTVTEGTFTPFLTNGIAGLLGTVGFVFVSYAGLTKIASVSEEVVNPGRNIPLGMMLSIISTTAIYVVGVLIMTIVLEDSAFLDSLTPVADAAGEVLPGDLGLLMVVAAAVAAFASTGNAGILAASRYPLAMGRDRLIPKQFARVHANTRTPIFSILFTGGLMIFAILALDESAIAKVASAFQLIIFMLINFAVIVMRESRIEFYDPVFRTPFYPWMQVFGIAASIFLLSYIGGDALLLTGGVVGAAILWYIYYANRRVQRHGAIYHWFERLGQQRYQGLEDELRDILREKGLRDEDPFDEVVTRAQVIDIERAANLDEIARLAAASITQKYPMIDIEAAVENFITSMGRNYTLIAHGATIPNLRHEAINHIEMVIIRVKDGVPVNYDNREETGAVPVNAFFFLTSPAENTGQHLRIMAQLANHIEVTDFTRDWIHAEGEQELKEILLHDERMLTLWVHEKSRTTRFIGKPLKDLGLPPGVLVALIKREGSVIIPRGTSQLQEGDRITIIGDPAQIDALYATYISDGRTRSEVAAQPE
ncbi:MAG: amino acid permease [Chloroflexota bacterium]